MTWPATIGNGRQTGITTPIMHRKNPAASTPREQTRPTILQIRSPNGCYAAAHLCPATNIAVATGVPQGCNRHLHQGPPTWASAVRAVSSKHKNNKSCYPEGSSLNNVDHCLLPGGRNTPVPRYYCFPIFDDIRVPSPKALFRT